MTELERAEQDAMYLLETYDHPVIQRVARILLAAIANPLTLAGEGYALVKKPELLGKGVPSR